MIPPDTVRQLALAFDEAVEQPHFGKTSYRVRKKIFATMDISKQQVMLKFSETDQSVFCAHDSGVIYPVAGAWGKQGWTVVELTRVHPDLFRDALSTAYCQVAPKSPGDTYASPPAS